MKKTTTAQRVGQYLFIVMTCVIAFIGYNLYHTIIGTPNPVQPVKCIVVDK